MQLAYKPGNTFLHRIDPITKFAWVLIASAWLYCLRDILNVTLVSVALSLFSFLAARLLFKQYIKLSVFMFVGGWMLLLYQGWARPGIGIAVGPLNFSYNGMSIGLALALRSFGLIAAGLAYSVTTSPQDLELSLEKIGVPYKIARVCYLSLRLIPTFQRDFQAIQDVQELRNPSKGFQRINVSLRAFLATEIRLVDTISIALETRGFGFRKERTNLKEVQISKKGVALAIVTLALMTLHLFLIR